MRIGRVWWDQVSMERSTIKNNQLKRVAFYKANLVSHVITQQLFDFIFLSWFPHQYISFSGIVGKVERHEWAHKRRDIAPVPAPIDDVNNRRISYEESKNNIIGGIDVENGSERWKTNYQRLAGQESTGRDQLTLLKRQLPKKILSGNNSVPNSARGPNSARIVYEQQSSVYSTSTTRETYGPIEGSLVGYKAPREVNRSLLSNISSHFNIDDFN